MATSGSIAFATAFQLSPIVLTGGIFATPGFPGGALPLLAITQPEAFLGGLLGGSNVASLDAFFANFHPSPGSTLLEYQVGTYPFANQAVAANAVIQQPRSLSMLMYCPAKGPEGYLLKLATMEILTTVLNYHIRNGGTFTVLTPAQIYINGLLLKLTDVSGGESKQAQNTYQWDFFFPLLTQEQASSVQGGLMSKLTNGVQLDGSASWSGLDVTNADPNSLGGIGLSPISTNTPAALQAPLTALNPVSGSVGGLAAGPPNLDLSGIRLSPGAAGGGGVV